MDMLDRYLANVDKIRISTPDAMCPSVLAGRGGICTFGDCLGEYLAVDPEGKIYSCQRFAGMPLYRLGNVHDCPSLEKLLVAPARRMFQERQERNAQECGDCAHFDFWRADAHIMCWPPTPATHGTMSAATIASTLMNTFSCSPKRTSIKRNRSSSCPCHHVKTSIACTETRGCRAVTRRPTGCSPGELARANRAATLTYPQDREYVWLNLRQGEP
jgi:radical SAM protein with 4Fe4S-binding SPASM domain